MKITHPASRIALTVLVTALGLALLIVGLQQISALQHRCDAVLASQTTCRLIVRAGLGLYLFACLYATMTALNKIWQRQLFKPRSEQAEE